MRTGSCFHSFFGPHDFRSGAPLLGQLRRKYLGIWFFKYFCKQQKQSFSKEWIYTIFPEYIIYPKYFLLAARKKPSPNNGWGGRTPKNAKPETAFIYSNIAQFFQAKKTDQNLARLSLQGWLSVAISWGRLHIFASTSYLDYVKTKK